eukprot:GHVR01125093.1.p1 GENE.GHVR01125093.1~~GHVR01125093.1.p1  ORF type:complete len:498 (+),score=73.23 GHVR01125093.1:169-1662(+)
MCIYLFFIFYSFFDNNMKAKAIVNPKNEVVVAPNASPSERLKAIENGWTLKKPQIDEILNAFVEDIQKGLESRGENSCMRMLDSRVKTIPTGEETGVFYSIDFGGTNFRVARFCLKGNGVIEEPKEGSFIKKNLKTNGPPGAAKGFLDKDVTATQLFDFIAIEIRDMMSSFGDGKNAPVSIGFTFSFPARQDHLDHYLMLKWTKGFETGMMTDDPVEGRDVGQLLREALKRNIVNANLVAVMNDTIGTLLSCAYSTGNEKNMPPVLMGIILGTGFNGCYVEPDYLKYGYEGKVINMEFGNFSINLPFTTQDAEVDDVCAYDRGMQFFEKMVSGKYMGELCRRVYCFVYQAAVPPAAWKEYTLLSEVVSQLLRDTSPNMTVSLEKLNRAWECDLSQDMLFALYDICKIVMGRSMLLAAISISAVAIHTKCLEEECEGRRGMTVAVDGSLYSLNKWYQQGLVDNINLVLGEQKGKLIHIRQADDGSGKGAAVLVATVSD